MLLTVPDQQASVFVRDAITRDRIRACMLGMCGTTELHFRVREAI